MIELTSSFKEIPEFLNLKDKSLAHKDRIICDSEKVVIKLLKSDIKILKIIAPFDFFEKYRTTYNFKNIECYFCSKELLKKIVGFKFHTGVMALAIRPKLAQLSELTFPAIILNGITSPENVGGIIRTARGFNINSIIFDIKTCSPLARRAIRVSIGNVFNMNLYESKNLLEDIKTIQNRGVAVIGTANIDEAENLQTYKFLTKSAIIIGSEGHGIEKQLLDSCNTVLKIPMNSDVAALNATSAASIFMYALNSTL